MNYRVIFITAGFIKPKRNAHSWRSIDLNDERWKMNYWLNKKAFFYIVNFLNSLTYVLRRGSFEKCSWSSTITRLIKSIWSVVQILSKHWSFESSHSSMFREPSLEKSTFSKFLTLVVYIFTNLLPWGSVQTR